MVSTMKNKQKPTDLDRFFYVTEEDIQEAFDSLSIDEKIDIKENNNDDTLVWQTLRTSSFYNL
jgi:hypothetical protein